MLRFVVVGLRNTNVDHLLVKGYLTSRHHNGRAIPPASGIPRHVRRSRSQGGAN
jgi:hypothetical protein